jgi:hypothetical protein
VPPSDILDVFAIEISNAGYTEATSSSLAVPSTSGGISTGPWAQALSGPALVFAGFEADQATSAAAQTGFTELAFIAMTGSLYHPLVILQGGNIAPGTTSTPGITWTGVSTSYPVVAATVVVNAIP